MKFISRMKFKIGLPLFPLSELRYITPFDEDIISSMNLGIKGKLHITFGLTIVQDFFPFLNPRYSIPHNEIY